MPVSSPGYFPAARTTDRVVGLTAGQNQLGNHVFLSNQNAGRNSRIDNIIVIGDDSLSAGVVDTGLNGSIVVGRQSAVALASIGTGGLAIARPVTVIGVGALKAAAAASSSVIIGDDACALYNPDPSNMVRSSVVIGSNAAANIVGSQSKTLRDAVIIGYGALGYNSGAGAEPGATNTIAIGAEALGQVADNGAGSVSNIVAIGRRAGYNISGNVVNTVIIGGNASPPTGLKGSNAVMVGDACGANNDSVAVGRAVQAGDNCVVIGSESATSPSADGCVVVGRGSGHPSLANYNTLIGARIAAFSGGAAANIVIGYRAGTGLATNSAFLFTVETQIPAQPAANILYGEMTAGNLICGNSLLSALPAGARTFGVGEQNTLKILYGTKGLSNPAGGGFFYYDSATGLHFVGEAGTDTPIAPP